jgi:hypothetical protein
VLTIRKTSVRDDVLFELTAAGERGVCGFDIAHRIGRRPRRVYPELARMVRAGDVVSFRRADAPMRLYRVRHLPLRARAPYPALTRLVRDGDVS